MRKRAQDEKGDGAVEVWVLMFCSWRTQSSHFIHTLSFKHEGVWTNSKENQSETGKSFHISVATPSALPDITKGVGFMRGEGRTGVEGSRKLWTFQFRVKLEMHILHACAPSHTRARSFMFLRRGWCQINKFSGSILGVTGVLASIKRMKNRVKKKKNAAAVNFSVRATYGDFNVWWR